MGGKMNLSKLLLNQDQIRLRADVKLGSNGATAKSAPVKLVANSGNPIDWPDLGGQLVWDFETMHHKGRIPLDYAHDSLAVIGYLNKIDIVNGSLICGGAITPFGDDRGAEVLAKMSEGVPYEASVESHGGTLDVIPEGITATINGREQVGPFFVLRDWELKAVAICKLGADSETSAELILAASKKQNEKKVFALSAMKEGVDMTNADEKVAETVEAPVVAEKPADVEVAPVEGKQPEVKVEAEAVDVAEVPATEAVEAKEAEPVVMQAAVDPRAEFKTFVATFGDKASDYFSEGLSFNDATTKHIAYQASQIVELKASLATAVPSRGAKPVAYQDGTDPAAKPKSLASAIRLK